MMGTQATNATKKTNASKINAKGNHDCKEEKCNDCKKTTNNNIVNDNTLDKSAFPNISELNKIIDPGDKIDNISTNY
jgi:hypothetical protein